nr:hypothetical protein [uncultured Allomuricauda sp.]
MKKTKNILALVLFLLFLVQYAAKLDFDYLMQLQTNPNYRKWSGFSLLIIILSQWILPVSRGIFDLTGNALEKMIAAHNWLGVISPLVFYFHSSRPDYGLLLFLTVVFFTNILVGVSLNSVSFNRYLRLGILLHIFLSASITILAVFHVWLVYYYN